MKNYGLGYLPENEQPYIEIEDDGDGMTLEIIEKVWLRPATPSKYEKKVRKQNETKKEELYREKKVLGDLLFTNLGKKLSCSPNRKIIMRLSLKWILPSLIPKK